MTEIAHKLHGKEPTLCVLRVCRFKYTQCEIRAGSMKSVCCWNLLMIKGRKQEYFWQCLYAIKF